MVDLHIWCNTQHANLPMTMAERFAELLIVNNGTTDITTVGKIKKATNKYGRVGLTVPEAFELANMTGQLAILYAIYPQQKPYFNQVVKNAIQDGTVELADASFLQGLGKPRIKKVIPG